MLQIENQDRLITCQKIKYSENHVGFSISHNIYQKIEDKYFRIATLFCNLRSRSNRVQYDQKSIKSFEVLRFPHSFFKY